MKEFPTPHANFGKISALIYKSVAAKVLTTAIELKLFDYLQNPNSAENLAKTIGLHVDNTAHFLDALCALDLLEKTNNLYRNSILAEDFLVSGEAMYIGSWLKIAEGDLHPVLSALPDLIRSGPDAIESPDHMNSTELCEKFTRSHASTSFAGVAHDIANSVASLPFFNGLQSMIDIGGGPGVNAMAVVSKNDRLTATVFDRPEIVRMAKEYIRDYGFSDRIQVCGGDYLKDPISGCYDMIMCTDSLYYTDDEIDMVLTKCRKSLNSGGYFVGVHAVINEEKPDIMTLGMFVENMTNSGSLPNEGFLEKALVRCGFTEVSTQKVKISDIYMEMNTGKAT